MAKITLLMALHNHQPVGNFDWVIEDAFERCYRPILDLFSSHPTIKFSIHFSGPLLDFMREKRPADEKLVMKMIESGQLELLGGGYYEPILASIPTEDALGQLAMTDRYLQDRFGVRPRGIWLTERIWEPSLPTLLAAAGVEFTIVDTAHFQYAGIEADNLYGDYITERHGDCVRIFPSDKQLRYMIPFYTVEENERFFAEAAEAAEAAGDCEIAFTYGDDGEKFGLWPGTSKWVYGERWLHKYLEMIEKNSDWLSTDHFGAYLDRSRPRQLVYFPTASYGEMLEWAMPAEAIVRYQDFKSKIEKCEGAEVETPFVRGGFWDNFLAKYPEANRMHKRMIYVSNRIVGADLSESTRARAQDHLYQAQCNCGYWHGLFGGLYLGHLRHAIYEHLIEADKLLDAELKPGPRASVIDFERRGENSGVIETDHLFALVLADYGGALALFEDKPSSFAVGNTLARRFEGYHPKLIEAAKETDAADDAPQSIHDRVVVKEEGLEKSLVRDRYQRLSFLDHFLPTDYDPLTLEDQSYREAASITAAPFRVQSFSDSTKAGIMLSAERAIILGSSECRVKISKSYSAFADEPVLEVVYNIERIGGAKINSLFGVEFNFTLLAGADPQRYYEIDREPPEDRNLNSAGVSRNVSEFALVNEWDRFALRVFFDRPQTLVRYPVETVSQSEGGFEKNYQASCIFALSPLMLDKQTAELKYRVEIERI